MKEQRGVHTSKLEERIQLNTIVYCVFKNALREAIDSGVSKDLPIYEFLEKANLHPERGIDVAMRSAYAVVVLGEKE